MRIPIFVGLLAAAVGLTPISSTAQTPPPTPPVGQSTQTQTQTQTSPPTTPPANPVPPAPGATAEAPPVTGRSAIIQRVLVKVNGEVFTQTDLEQKQTEALAAKNQQANVKTAETDAVLQRELQQITPGLIVEVVDDMLLVQKARELGYKLSDDQFQKFIDDLKADNHIQDDAAFDKALTEQGMTKEQLRKTYEERYLRQAVQQSEVMSHAQMTDQEARQYYAAHQAEFMTPAKVVLREILIAVPTQATSGQASFSAGVDDAARDKANAIHDRLMKGEDFVKVAAEVSDSPSKATGGLIGDVNVNDMSDTLRPLIDALKPGEITPPVRTQRGYQILKLDSRSPEQPKPFDDVRETIAQKIYEQRVDGETQKYLDKVRAQALIEWKDQNLEDMYDKQLSDMKKAGGG
jgi:peptidyl-prolyl cis-trans isomerase SurA